VGGAGGRQGVRAAQVGDSGVEGGARRRGGVRRQGHRPLRAGRRGAAAGGPGQAGAVQRPPHQEGGGVPRRAPRGVRLNSEERRCRWSR
jgi:hypothetical protein